jgi:ACS family hexuronate transporter-like MFS transporter
MAARWRWLAVGVFVLSSSLNYLDRLLLAAVAPTIKNEFSLNNAQYGMIVAVFSLVYAAMAPASGWWIDRVGLNIGITVSMAVWSAAGIATGLTRSFAGLLVSRTVLGAAESAGIPAAGKANGMYLEPKELAFGTALNQAGITIGSVAAPLMVAMLAPVYGWRAVFAGCGALGFAWIPAWWLTARRVPAGTSKTAAPPLGIGRILRDRRIIALAAANALVMTLYTLWSNWTTLYFVTEHHLTQTQANQRFAWIPPVFATLGGLYGGWRAFRLMHRGADVLTARMRVCWTAALVLLVTAAVPFIRQPAPAAALISVSFFWCLAISTNLYAMPIDFLGAGQAAFGVSILTASFGLMQTAISPLIGAAVDKFGFGPVCVVLAGIVVLRGVVRWR